MHTKQAIRRNFARRAGTYDRHADIQRFMAQELLARCGEAVVRAGRILEVGCGTGYLTEALRRLNPAARLVAVDLDETLIARARRRLGHDPLIDWVIADGEALGRGRFDLIISNSAVQWFTDPGGTLDNYGQNLDPGGVLAFSTLGPGTFRELAASLKTAAEDLNLAAWPGVAAQGFPGQGDWADHLARAGFGEAELSQTLITRHYPSVRDFLKALQATGALNPTPRPFSPRFLRAMQTAYTERFRQNGSVPASYEVIWAVASR